MASSGFSVACTTISYAVDYLCSRSVVVTVMGGARLGL